VSAKSTPFFAWTLSDLTFRLAPRWFPIRICRRDHSAAKGASHAGDCTEVGFAAWWPTAPNRSRCECRL